MRISAFATALVLAASAALAGPPVQTAIDPADLFIIVPRGNPSAQSHYIQPQTMGNYFLSMPTSNAVFGTGLFSKSHLSTTGIDSTLDAIHNTSGIAPTVNTGALQGILVTDTPTISANNQGGAAFFVGGVFSATGDTSNGGVGTVTLTGTVHSTDTVLPVSSITGIRNGDSIEVTLDTGELFVTTINGTPSGGNVTISPAMPATATSGNNVYDYAGEVTGAISQGILTTKGKHWFGAVGFEASNSLRTGSSVFFKCVLCASNNNDDTVAADGPWDMMMGMSGQPGSIGAKVGLGVGPWSSAPPIQTTGTIIKTFGKDTVANGVDFSSYTITGDAWKSEGFEVAGNGTNTQTSSAPSYVMRATGTAVTAGGLWRLVTAGGVTVLQVNTAAGGDFSTHIDVLKFTDTGGLQLSGTTVDPGVGAINAGAYVVGDVVGVTCSGSPTSSFAAINGIVTHC